MEMTGIIPIKEVEKMISDCLTQKGFKVKTVELSWDEYASVAGFEVTFDLGSVSAVVPELMFPPGVRG